MHGEREVNDQSDRAADVHVAVERRLQSQVLGGRVSAVERAQCAHDHLARQHRGEQADANLPVEAEGPDDRLDYEADTSDDALR